MLRFIFKGDKKSNKTIDSDHDNNIWSSLTKRRSLPISKVAGRIFLIYVLIVLFGGFLLCIPGFVQPKGRDVIDSDGKYLGHYNFSWKYLVGLFTASSAFSDTGLTIPTTASDYTFWGQLVILILIQIGGFGVLTFKIIFLNLLGRKISIRNRILVQGERGGTSFGETMDLIKHSFYFLLTIELFAMLLLFLNFYFYPPFSKGEDNENWRFMIDNVTYRKFWPSLWSATFHSVSAINNAGFDIVGNSSLRPYNTNYFMQFIFIFEFVIGGLGFPTFYDVKKKIQAWRRKEKFRFSLFTKINVVVYLGVSVIGCLSIWLIEFTQLDATIIDANNNRIHLEKILRNSSSTWNGFMNIFFNSMSTRNAGFSTVDMGDFLPGSKLVMSIMMFIGSAPSSTAGGIRTTTFGIILITIWAVIRNNNNVNAFKRRIPAEVVRRALVVTIISVMVVSLATLIVSADNPNLSVIDILFMICSAFGTTGLNSFSYQTMNQLSALSLFAIILPMFIGQLGVSSTLLISIKGSGDKDYNYVEENIHIG